MNREPTLSGERRAELGWAAFCIACAAAMLLLPQWQTVPFHWIWITITLLYGYHRWSNLRTAVVLLGVTVITTITMLRTDVERAELSEIPLMAGVFVAMVWHVRRRQDAVDEQRRIAEREREFMRDAAHSLRTPLTVAQGHAELLRDALEPGSQNRDDAVVMLDELRRLGRIADQLLVLSAAGHADALLLAPVRLDVLVHDAGAAVERSEPARDHRGRPGPVCVLGDEQRLRQSLDALIENALNATCPGDRVTVGAAVCDAWAELVVTDTGCGIAPADADRIFERFARGPHPADRPGTGLGLPIVKAITEAHGGTVTVTSRPAHGSTFRLRIGPARAPGPTERSRLPLSPGRRGP